MLFIYGVTVFLSAFLLFMVQPMLTKALLPGFGGSYLVWGAAMVFYQGVLLAGYIFSHHVQRWLGVARYARWHWLMLLAPFLFFPFHFERLAHGPTSLSLAMGVFFMLLVTVGIPFLTLSMTSLVLQRWISIKKPDANPYVLYSASNLGSISALLLYPVLIEPLCGLHIQGMLWWTGYTVLVALHAVCMPYKNKGDLDVRSGEGGVVTMADKLRWLLLSMAACAMLLAVTNVMTLDIASIPFLWVLPLAVYLLGFVVAFKRVMWFPDWMRRGLYWAVVVGVGLHLMSQLRLTPPVAVAILLQMGILFVVSVNCCGWLARTRPDDDNELTTFYVMIAFGGLLGSLLVSWVVPLISNSLVEGMLAFMLVFVAVGFAAEKGGDGIKPAGLALDFVAAVMAATLLPAIAGKLAMPQEAVIVIALPMALLLRYRAGRPWHTAMLMLGLTLATPWTEELAVGAREVTRLRNYYGIYKIYDIDGIRYLEHGTTEHGREYLAGPKRFVPLAYYHPTTPVAGVLQCQELHLKNIGMIGLGSGALAAYFGHGQQFTIYEIDPDNRDVAENMFGYIGYARRNGAKVNYVFGDGRVSLRSCPDNNYDIFMLDAFSSGSIPVHLLTTQAFREYLRVVGKHGIVLLHVSNRMLNLMPVVYSNARALKIYVCEQNNSGNCNPDAEPTYWAALTADPAKFRLLTQKLGWWVRKDTNLPAPWTDQYSNVPGAIIWK